MHSRLRAGLIAGAAGLLALVLGGCGSGTAAIDPVAQAAIATTHAGGAQMAMRAQIALGAPASPVTMSATGEFNFATDEGEIVSSVSGLPDAALGTLHASSLSFTELFAKDVLFIRSPLFAGRLPGGARWIRLELKSLARGVGLDAQSLSSGQTDPAQVLSYLKAGGGSVSKVGTELLRGTETTRYRGTIDLAKAAARLSGPGGPTRSAIEQLTSQIAGSGIVPVEVWVDGHGRLRRTTISLSGAAGGARAKVSLTLELFDFGATPAVNLPSGSEVFDATATSLSLLGRGARAGG